MNTLRQTLILIVVIMISTATVFAQSKSEAEQLYDNLGYKKSAAMLEEQIANGKIDINEEVILYLANSYRLNHDTEMAEKWYAQAVGISSEPINNLYYAQALQSNGNFELAKQYYEKYAMFSGANDKRGELLAASIERMGELKNIYAEVKNEYTLNSDKLDFSPTYFNDGIVFVSSREGIKSGKKDTWIDDNFMSLFYASKNTNGTLEAPTEFSYHISTPYHEGPVTFNKAGDQIFFTRNNFNNGKKIKNQKGVIKLKIYTAKKSGDDWGAAKELAFNTNEYDECHPTLSPDGRTLIFSSNRSGNGGMDLFKSTFQGDEWSSPVNLGPSINTKGNEVFPFFHDDGTLYFASDGWGGLGGLDIFSSISPDNTSWAEATNIGAPFNSQKDDFGFIMNVLGTEGYFSSARAGGQGQDDIYSFMVAANSVKRPIVDNNNVTTEDFAYQSSSSQSVTDVMQEKGISTPPATAPIIRNCLSVNGIVNDMEYGQRLINAAVTLTNNCTGQVINLMTNAVGEFTSDCIDCSCEYTLKATKNSYFSASGIVNFDAQKCSTGGSQNFVLKLAPIEDNTASRAANSYSNTSISYGATGVTDTYGSRGVSNSYNSGTYTNSYDNNVHAGMVIELEDIYYDFDDYRIRNDASRSLDMLADLMSKYPSMEIELSSHTDKRGDSKYNYDLSKRRARYAKKYLVSKGIEAARINTQGYGEDQPRANCQDVCSESEHQSNRRTVVKVTRLDNNIQVIYRAAPSFFDHGHGH